ncbi:hypothetical protein QTP86_010864, partial [Hemibagrus guttatus]
MVVPRNLSDSTVGTVLFMMFFVDCLPFGVESKSRHTIRIRPFLSTQATQVLVQSLVISRLDYCNSLLAGLPLNAIRPLQIIQNAAARLVFNLPKFSHTTPLLRSLHWLPVAARIRFKTLMLAYKAKNGPAPSYLKALVTPRTAPRSLRSTSTARLVPPSLREKEMNTKSSKLHDIWMDLQFFKITADFPSDQAANDCSFSTMAQKEKLQCLKDFHKDTLKPSPGKSPGTRPEDEAEGKPPQREKWASKLDFLLSVAGGFVGLGNVWRFPYLCYKNGGGAFLIPYFIFLFGGGLPVFFLEVALGQFTSEGGITCWEKLCPIFTGIGYASIVIVSLLNIYYIVILAWGLYYLLQCLQRELPWARCRHSWNTPNCVEDTIRKNKTLWLSANVTNFTSPVTEFWEHNVLSLSSGVDEVGELKWDLALCLLAVWVICFFCIWKGVKSTGK